MQESVSEAKELNMMFVMMKIWVNAPKLEVEICQNLEIKIGLLAYQQSDMILKSRKDKVLLTQM